jgi:hypothetical protein
MYVTGHQLCERCERYKECLVFIGVVQRCAREINSLEARSRRQFGADTLIIECKRFNPRKEWRLST